MGQFSQGANVTEGSFLREAILQGLVLRGGGGGYFHGGHFSQSSEILLMLLNLICLMRVNFCNKSESTVHSVAYRGGSS